MLSYFSFTSEATASGKFFYQFNEKLLTLFFFCLVDFENDEKIQATIRTEFRDKTLLCIAHRLRTIIAYDRVLVMDAGKIAEFDTPSNLFVRGGIFYGLCCQSGITLSDIASSRSL